MKKKGIGSEARAELMDKADADLELLNHSEQERQLLKQKRRRNQGREEDVCICTVSCMKPFVMLFICCYGLLKGKFYTMLSFPAIYEVLACLALI